MKFCIECGASSVSFRIPHGDNRPRSVCDNCDYIHYLNPKSVCGTLPIHDGKILLCKREIQPRAGYWTLPAGFMENGETLQGASVRETFEEANAQAVDPKLYSVFSLPHINQVHFFYKCGIEDGIFSAGSETLEAQLFEINNIPWDELAFKTITRCLEQYVEDCQTNSFPMHIEDILVNPHQA